MMKKLTFAVIALALLVCGSAAHADSITFTETITLSGSLDGTPFNSALVTFTVVGNTANSSNGGSGTVYRLPGVTTVNVAGVGSDTLSDASTGVSDNQTSGLAGVADFTTHVGLVFTIDPSVFDTYFLTTSIGPVSGSSEVSLFTFATTGGDLVITSGASTATFGAVEATPEPPSWFMLVIGLLALGGVRKLKLQTTPAAA
jgi:hypothetical protein